MARNTEIMEESDGGIRSAAIEQMRSNNGSLRQTRNGVYN